MPLDSQISEGFSLDRRDVLKGAGGLVVCFTIAATPRAALAATPTPNLGAYIQIASDNSVTVFIGATEMGQGIMTGMAQLVAEELMVPWSSVSAVHAPAAAAYANSLFHIQATGGSTSMRAWYTGLRNAASVARQQLLIAGAASLNQPVANCSTGNGKVFVTASPNQSVAYGTIVGAAAGVAPPSPAPVSSLKIIGQRLPRTDIPAKVNGSAIYGIDVQIPGMVYASVVHAPVLGGTVASLPSNSNGHTYVNLGDAVGVVSTDTWSAMNAANSLRVTWTTPASTDPVDSAKILAVGQSLVTSTSVTPQTMETVGTAAAALAGAKTKIDATYSLPYLAHACMEVLNCTVSITSAGCEMWVPTQGQTLCVLTAQSILGASTPVTVHTTYLGGGLGRKFEQDYVAQAVKIAQAVGKPVKLTWSRTQDFKNDRYRPCALIRVQAGLDGSGKFSSLVYRNVSPSIAAQNNTTPGSSPEDPGAVAGALGLPYAIANRLIEYVPNPAAVPIGYWRSVGESYNIFAVESAVDELATAAGVDPIAFRQSLLAGQPGLAVLNAAVAMSNAVPVSHGSARGVAFMVGFGSIIALVVEVSGSSATSLRVSRAFCALDCGTVVNPDAVEAQIQGGIAHGISATLWGQVTFAAGVPNVSNFNGYRMVRSGDMPVVQVQTVNTGAISIGGVGEVGVPCVAPAIANAFAKLTGQRIRTLPFAPGASGGGDD